MKLSVIIPALNEYNYISNTIDSIRLKAILGNPNEIIVVDCGSTDGTPDLVKQLRVKLIQCIPSMAGRAEPLNLGASAATGDVLLFLDADSILPIGYDSDISNALLNTEIVGGAFEFALDGKGFGLRLIELINRIRYRISHEFYGDQGIFVRTGVFHKLGGYPKREILESSEFCSSIRRTGKLALVRKCVKTSPRRFHEGGVYRVFVNDVKIWWLNLIGRQVDRFGNKYWKENIMRGKN
ncbi:TIGR04283 family arsenosugar biosynthesis glycosyltransferase [Desulfobacterota bacterium AH_259_B03_O07]|nr:TIGR04283 family arsenosugar biosynthesis glycosyltransferase [Desulfobacterota bacterium AH_259_B03_O07]